MKLSHHEGCQKGRRFLPAGVGAALLLVGCSAGDRALLGELIDGLNDGNGSPSGGATPDACSVLVTGDDLYAAVAADLSAADADDALFFRYLSLSNQANARGCGSALDRERTALNKLVNSLSIDATISNPLPIDVERTLYRIDMRDYGWDRDVRVGNQRFPDGWEAIISSSPYAVPFVGDDADDAVADTGTLVPVLFGDALVAAAARAPLYYALLDIPRDIDDFLSADLGIDVQQERADANSRRAGFVGLAPSRGGSEFIAERFNVQVRSGFVWEISEVRGASGALFEDPLTGARGERELVFTLSNGLLGHALAGANGRVRNASDVVLDALEGDLRAKIAHSYMREHAQGVQVRDQVRQFALDNPSRFTAEELQAILALYPAEAELEALLEQDRAWVARGLARAEVDIDDTPEPVSQTFAERAADVDLASAAGDLLLSTEELRDNLALLDPALQVLDGGSVPRGEFDALYVASLCVLSVVRENQPDPVICP